MEEYAGLDVSLKAVSICVSDGTGRVLWRGEVMNEPDVVAATLSRHAPNLVRAVLETCSCGVHLYRGLEVAAVPIVCICARHAKGVLKCKVNKSDANDAEGLAHLARTGWYREVYVKSAQAHVIRAHLLARKQVVKARRDFENQIRALLRISGIKVGAVARGRFEERVRRLLERIPALHLPVDQLLMARRSLLASQDALETEAKTLDDVLLRQGVAAVFDSDEKGFYLVAEANGSVVGSLLITYEWSDWRNGMFWWIQSVYVAPDLRRKGVYRALHRHVEAAARRTPGVCGIRLYVESENAAAQNAYHQLGMVRTGYLMFETDWSAARPHDG